MKKFFIAAIAFVTFVSQTSAKPDQPALKGDSVNSYVNNNASAIVWKSVDNFKIANFIKDGYRMKAFYDENGKLFSTTRYLKSKSQLPLKAQENIDKNYPGWGMTELFEENGIERESIYYAKVSDGVNSFIIKITKEGRISKF